MDAWTIAALMVPAHVLGSALALAIVSINRDEADDGPMPCARPVTVDPRGVPRMPWG